MNSSYGRKRGDLTGAKYAGRVDVYWINEVVTDQWGRKSLRHQTHWVPWSDTGDARSYAQTIANRVGGKIVDHVLDPHVNGGCGYTWQARNDSQLIVIL